MADYITYGISFPFQDSQKGKFLKLTEDPRDEVKSNLIHLLMTRKGTRYFLPDFGTRLHEFIFEQKDSITKTQIRQEIDESVKRYLPQVRINEISLLTTEEAEVIENIDEYTVKVRIDYSITSGSFDESDTITIVL